MPSTAIRALAYDPDSRTLFVTFTSGEIYAYGEVAPEAYEAFRSAGSRGGFFAARIRDRYPYRRLTGRPSGWTAPLRPRPATAVPPRRRPAAGR